MRKLLAFTTTITLFGLILSTTPVSAESKFSGRLDASASNLDQKIGLATVYETSWTNNLLFHLDVVAEFGHGIDYTLDPLYWSPSRLTERSVFTAKELYLKYSQDDRYEIGAGLKIFQFGALERLNTVLDLVNTDSLEILHIIPLAQPSIWGQYDFGQFSVAAKVNYQTADKVPWNKGNPFRPDAFGDKGLMKAHCAENIKNVTVWADWASSDFLLRLLYSHGEKPGATVQNGKFEDNHKPIEADWQPQDNFQLGFFMNLSRNFKINFGTGVSLVEEWKDDTLDWEASVIWKKNNLLLHLSSKNRL